MLGFADDAALARLVIAAAQRRARLPLDELSDRAVEGMPARARRGDARGGDGGVRK
jgi:hypothetical protein